MSQVPPKNQNNDKHQESTLMHFLNSLKNNIQAMTNFANTNNSKDNNSDIDWDDDWDNDYTSKMNKSPKAIAQKGNKKTHNYRQYSSGNEQLKSIIYAVVFLVGIILCGYLFFNINTEKRPISLSTEYSTPKTTDLPIGKRKLEKPLFGSPNNSDDELDESDPLAQIDFDFSPTSSLQISRMPVLPKKVKQVKKNNNLQEFENIWQNGNKNKDIKQIHGDPNNPISFLPPWRRFSTSYPPTEGLPVFSVILEYDPSTLDVEDLPPGQGYNIILPGFLQNADSLVKKLQAKGYEILLYLPMDNNNKTLSFKAITDKSTFDDIRDAITFHTSQLGGEGFIGFMNYGGIEVRESLPKMNFMMSLLSETGYLYIDNEASNPKSLAFAAAEGQKVPSLKSKNYIEAISKDFKPFLQQVKLDGYGIAIIKATAENILALNHYDILVKQEKLRRIPVSGILRHQMLKKIDKY